MMLWLCLTLLMTQVDDRLQRQLEVARLQVAVDKDGDFQAGFELPNGRRQTVFINQRTEKVGSLQLREVWSPALTFEVELDPVIAERALRDSDRYAVGAWSIKDWGNTSVLVFAAKVPAEMTPTQWRDLAELIAGAADAMENLAGNGADAW